MLVWWMQLRYEHDLITVFHAGSLLRYYQIGSVFSLTVCVTRVVIIRLLVWWAPVQVIIHIFSLSYGLRMRLQCYSTQIWRNHDECLRAFFVPSVHFRSFHCHIYSSHICIGCCVMSAAMKLYELTSTVIVFSLNHHCLFELQIWQKSSGWMVMTVTTKKC